jgi:fructose-1-phosphate kinase PfkB-like protein
LKGWSLEESVRFSTAAASLKVTRPGLQMFPIAEIKALAAQLSVERSDLADYPRH